MKISDLIKQLQLLKKEHDNLCVKTYEMADLGVIDYCGPQIKYIRAKRGREYKTYYGYRYMPDDVFIEKVLHI